MTVEETQKLLGYGRARWDAVRILHRLFALTEDEKAMELLIAAEFALMYRWRYGVDYL